MSRHHSSPSVRLPAGPRIEFDFEDDATTPNVASRSMPGRGGAQRAATAAPATGAPTSAPRRFSGLLTAAIVLAATGATVFGLLYLNDRLAGGSRASGNARSLATALPIPVGDERLAAPAASTAPDEADLAALESGSEAAMAQALLDLRRKDVTPAGLRAVNAAAQRTQDVELQRQVTCYRVRGGAPLDAAFAALPAAGADDPEWKAAGADCLIEAIAGRANEAPERAIGPAVAAGAATRWPGVVQAWLADRDPHVRRIAHAELVRQGDPDSRLAAARALAADTSDEELAQWAAAQVASGDGFDRQFAAVAADITQPAAARARAADLVGQHGSAAACRLVAAIASAEPALEAELQATRLRIDRRFGPSLRASLRR